MIGFEINNVKYKFYFSYVRKNKDNKKDIVYCHFEKSDDKTIILSSSAHCSPEDNFSKETGRQISLIRCIYELYYIYFLHFNREDGDLIKNELIKIIHEYYKLDNGTIRKIALPEKESIMLNKLLLFHI
jgi:hypothetical protein